jgi:hypothetical protein
MVERFFPDLTQNQLKRDILRDLEELIMAVPGTSWKRLPERARQLKKYKACETLH